MNKKIVLEESFHVSIVLISAIVYSLGVMWFITPAGLYSSGVTGLGQIMSDIIALCTGGKVIVPLGVFTFVLNIPLFVYGWKKVSIRFAVYSLLSVVVQSIIMMGWIPEYTFGINAKENQLLFALIGGLITGLANGIALRFGTSTGGLDIIAQALSIEKGVSIGTFSMIFNCLIALIGGGAIAGAWEISMYTFIRIIITSIVVDKIHTAYNFVRLDIISEHVDAISTRIMEELKRGVTLMSVEGAYTHTQKRDAFVILTSYELARAKKICMEVDPNVFVIIAPAKGTIGRFVRKTIM
ncbi:MAG: YitT family protein [Roseburia sp.]|nr:YitT family protein [Anaeroplasma bactoclasticum]MCM1196577.1 YitT family protein [Roseburia sp.]MCM1557101.1 YitT family protein [Anaeroplasma bactoclasticum]